MERAYAVYHAVMKKAKEGAYAVYHAVMRKAKEGAYAVYHAVMKKAEEGTSTVYDVVMGEAEGGASAAYDVFISHRGPDTKNNIVSVIYRDLTKYGLRVFFDKEEMKPGDRIDNTLKSVIRKSLVHVAIFSKRYAESSWCLDELLYMLESGRKIIPIFCDVQPRDHHNIMGGCYADAFLNRHSQCKREEVDAWKNALHEAAKISGILFNTEEDFHGNFLDKIVESVLPEVAKWKELQVAEYPVGLHQAEADFNKFLQERQLNCTTEANFNNFLQERQLSCPTEADFNEFLQEWQLSGTTVVGIMGLQGSGKSTLVRHLYNRYLQNRRFRRYCFLSELNEKDLTVLQQNLVRDLLGLDNFSIKDATDGEGKLRQCLSRHGPFLIVLDGLCKTQQIDSLLNVVKEALVDSLIFVTCSNRNLLKRGKVKLFYNVKLLEGEDAHGLFCSYALYPPKSQDIQDLQDLVIHFVEICGGFPSALKKLGQDLSCERNRRFWEEELEELRESSDNTVDDILGVTYKCLEEKEREVFLDVAHFLVEENKDLAVRVLGGLYGRVLISLRELQDKCLLDFEDIEHWNSRYAKEPDIQWRAEGSSKIRMDVAVRKMARRKALSSLRTTPLRLCQLANRSILEELKYRGYHVRGIRCECLDEAEMTNEEIYNEIIHELKLLVLHDYRVPFPFNHLHGDLVWLRIHKANWGNTFPSTLSLQNLRVLELHGFKLEALGSMDGNKFPSKLDELTVDYCGESAEIPEWNLSSSSSSASGSVWDWSGFRQLTNLVKMVLKNVKGLKSLPIDFEAISKLSYLDLSGCSDLEKMPDSFTGLCQLQYLALHDCKSLSISDLGGITKLEYLDFEGCSSLQELPDKTTAQKELRYLNLRGTSIRELPQDFKNLMKSGRIKLVTTREEKKEVDNFFWRFIKKIM